MNSTNLASLSRASSVTRTGSADQIGLVTLLLLGLECALLFGVLHLFRLEESFGLLKITPLILVGFLLNSVLPLRFRGVFFLGLSGAAILTVVGLVPGILLLLLGLGLIATCHLPIKFGWRIALLCAAGVALAFVRSDLIQTPWGTVQSLIIPLLGAMFMFRLAIYVYDLQHEKKPVSIWTRLSYFFMLPNVCFPLFPVVDFQSFRRTYYDAPARDIYQKGITWICRGIVHLLLYRLIYYNLIPSPAEVQTLGGVVYLMVTTYLLYLRISGQFHLIIGIMCLFGFNLPETHHLYFLASSFTDYWRRINIYWKDFMMKMFYYPSFTRLKKLGMRPALVISTLIVFGGTWLLHSYQWFWLQGAFPLAAPDALFWGILGLAVVLNTLRELRSGAKKKSLGSKRWSFRHALEHSARVVSTVTLITVLWMLWSSSSVGEFLGLLKVAAQSSAVEWALLILGLLGLVAIGVGVQFVLARLQNLPSLPILSFGRSVALTSATALVLLAIAQPQLYRQVKPPVAVALASLHESGLNQRDTEQMNRGYYEGLLDSRKHIAALWTGQDSPSDWTTPRDAGAYLDTGDMLDYELRPSWRGEVKRAVFTSNRWGMHDREYEQARPPDTYRFVQLGSSYAFAAGLSVDQSFEAVLEDRLNETRTDANAPRFEVLNFALGGYSVLNNLAVLRQKALQFEPNAVLLVLHTTELSRLNTHLYQTITGKIQQTDAFIEQIIEESGARADMERDEIDRRLSPYLEPLMEWALDQIAATAREHSIEPIAVIMPMTEEWRRMREPQRTQLIDAATEAGFRVVTLDHAYGEYAREETQLAPWDWHPNALGNRLLGESMFAALSGEGLIAEAIESIDMASDSTL